MKKLVVNIPDSLYEKMEKTKITWGYASKSEFFRYAIQTYLDSRDKSLAQAFMEHSPL